MSTSAISSMLFVSLALATGPWVGSAFGPGLQGPTIQCPGVARVSLVPNRDDARWSVVIENLSDRAIVVDVDARFKPASLSGPIRVRQTVISDASIAPTGRVITRAGGVVNGARIDADADAWFRDRFQIGVPAKSAIVVGAEILACQLEDLDGNGAVDAADLAICVGAWGATNVAADINKDGVVDSIDLAHVVGQFSEPPQTPAEGNDLDAPDPLTIDAPPPDPIPEPVPAP